MEEQLRSMATQKDCKQLLIENRRLLITKLTHVTEIVHILQEYQIFSQQAVEQMNKETKSRGDKIGWILDALPRRSQLGYAILVEMLKLTNQHELFNKLYTNGLVLPGIQLQRPYLKELAVHNKTKIKLIKEEKKIRDTDYIQLNMYKDPSEDFSAERRGIKEVNMNEKHTIKVNLEDLFAKTIKGTKENEEPRLVLLQGVPGSGKSHTCLHIVEQANEGHWKYPNTVPFFFCMRDIPKPRDTTDDTTSLKDFLMDKCGPETNHKDDIWKTLVEDDNFFIIIDALDEDPLDCLSEQDTINKVEERANIRVVLNSLIKGILLPHAKLLLTSRVYSTVKVQTFTQRIFELGGIPTEKLFKLFKAELSKDKYELAKELLQSNDLLDHAKVPVHAFGLIDFFEFVDRGKIETQTDVLFSIIIAKIVKTDRQKNENNFTDLEQVVQYRAKELRQIANLSKASFKTENTTMAFTRAELDGHEVTDDAIKCGIFTAYISSLRNVLGPRKEEKYHVPHLATFQLLAGLGNTQENVECLRSLVKRNNGQLDMVILYTAGFLGNRTFLKVLQQIFPETNPDSYKKKAEELMKAVMTSSRRHTLTGELFVIHTIAESQQWQLAPDVQRFLTSMTIDTSMAIDRQPSRKAIKKVAEKESDELSLTVGARKTPTAAKMKVGFLHKITGLGAELKRQTLTAVGSSDHIASSSASPPTQLCGSLVLITPFLNACDSIALGKLLTHTATPYSRVLVLGDIGINGLSRLAASAPCVTVDGTPISSTDLQQSHDQLTGLHCLGLCDADISRYTLPVIAPALAPSSGGSRLEL